MSSEQETALAEIRAAWGQAIEKFSEGVSNLQAATRLTMDHRAGLPPLSDPNYCITSELMSKALRSAAGAVGNFHERRCGNPNNDYSNRHRNPDRYEVYPAG